MKGWTVEKFCLKDQILMTLKIKFNLFRFNTSELIVGNIIFTFVSVLHKILYVNLMNSVPSQNNNRNFLPVCFNIFSKLQNYIIFHLKLMREELWLDCEVRLVNF